MLVGSLSDRQFARPDHLFPANAIIFIISEVSMWAKLLDFGRGQGLAEYAVVLLFVAVAVVAILAIFGPQVGELYSRITAGIP